MNIEHHELKAREPVTSYHDGKTSAANCQMLCRKCNREKAARSD